MSQEELPIEPSTRVGVLLDSYPELEEVLIGMAPPFKKLKNPILRRGIGKVASLRQVAAVGRMPVDELVNELRAATGQEAIAVEDAGRENAFEFTWLLSLHRVAGARASFDKLRMLAWAS